MLPPQFDTSLAHLTQCCSRFDTYSHVAHLTQMAHLTQVAHLSQNLHCGKESLRCRVGTRGSRPAEPSTSLRVSPPVGAASETTRSSRHGPVLRMVLPWRGLRTSFTLLPDLIHDCVPVRDAGPAGPTHPEPHRLARPHTPRATFPRRGSPERGRTHVRGLAQFSLRRVPQELVGSRLLHSGCSGRLQGALTHTNGGWR